MLSERIWVDNNATEKLDIERKGVKEKSVNIDFDKNLQNITDDKQNRKNFFSDVVKSAVSYIEETPENGKTVVTLKNIHFILLRDDNLNSSKIQNSPLGICADSSISGNAFSNVSLSVQLEVSCKQDEELLEILVELPKSIKLTIGRKW